MSKEVIKYINRLKKKAIKILNNLPEHWQHEHLKEAQVIIRIILDLREIIGYDEEDKDLEWLMSNFPEEGSTPHGRRLPKSYIKIKKDE